MHKLALSIVLTSQGISFLHAGTEFLRSKKGNDNSFNAGDNINAIDWSLKTKNKDVFDYVRSLIKLRKEHPAFRMETAEQIANNLLFIDNLPEGIVAYTINGAGVQDSWKRILVIFNGTRRQNTFVLPRTKTGWKSWFHRESDKMLEDVRAEKFFLAPYSCSILYE
jgi:pullulanase